MQVEANREVEGQHALIIKGTAISGFIKKFRNYDYC